MLFRSKSRGQLVKNTVSWLDWKQVLAILRVKLEQFDFPQSAMSKSGGISSAMPDNDDAPHHERDEFQPNAAIAWINGCFGRIVNVELAVPFVVSHFTLVIIAVAVQGKDKQLGLIEFLLGLMSYLYPDSSNRIILALLSAPGESVKCARKK